METRKRVLGDEHPSTLTSMANLAYTFKNQGDVDRAVSLMQDCYKRQVEVLGPRHPDAISSREALSAWRLEA
ncbi:hypothetical protein EJ04DRAFT_82483 [Polyplosphaeria fusca]|uniref:Kinesin light chain n=1 Tax=Polyplosphaeria fusca TaxID=682080 RepID=A0A9P4QM35_9PLEO|nr:hypothetical protein EJ04DRAFT_82483 [Polyplosphaeria fusca]